MYKNLNPDKIFFTADLHCGHKNIIKYCDRPFNNINEMNQTLVNNWNDVVLEDDIVFVLGDFSYKMKSNDILHILKSLNGRKVLITGNHDYKGIMKKQYLKDEFELIIPLLEIGVNDSSKRLISLCHYAMLTWPQSNKNSWHLFGHSHGNLNGDLRLSNRQMDVGVDCNNYKPFTYQEIKNKLNE